MACCQIHESLFIPLLHISNSKTVLEPDLPFFWLGAFPTGANKGEEEDLKEIKKIRMRSSFIGQSCRLMRAKSLFDIF